MFFDDNIRADHLPRKTVCLTYDDGPGESDGEGPGPHTWELGRYLHEEGIRATFFLIGKHAERFPDTVAALRAWGHLLGNHTYGHPGLVALAEQGGDVVAEVKRADEVLGGCLDGPRTFFRAPYGSWRQTAPPDHREFRARSIVAQRLNASGAFPNYVGPVHWDVIGEDWNCWRSEMPVEVAAELHLRAIVEAGRGVVLMHDSAEEEGLRSRNQTMRMTKLLIPALKWRGFRFIRLDEIPQVQTAAMVTALALIATPDGRSLRVGLEGNAVSAGPRQLFGLVPWEGGRFALRARNGMFLSAGGDGGPVAATSPTIGPAESFEINRVRRSEVTFRSEAGAYLVFPKSGDPPQLLSSLRRGDRTRFGFDVVHAEPGHAVC